MGVFLDTQEKILWTPSQWDFHNLLRSSGENRLSYPTDRTTPLPLNYWGWGWGEGGDGGEYILASGCPCMLVSVQI